MEDENKPEGEAVEPNPEGSRSDKRIKELYEEAKDAKKVADEAKQTAESATREAGFYKEFSGMIAKYPQAAEYQDIIKEKAMAGYTPEDATLAILAKEGKLGQVQVDIPAGGSAVNQPPEKPKSVSEMSREEKLSALLEAEKQGLISL